MSPATPAEGTRPWWSTWPGALAVGAVSLVLVGVTALPLILIALTTSTDLTGTDLTVDDSGGMAWKIAYVVLGIAFLAVPVGVVVVARKMWLGWVLVLLAISAVILGAGLVTLGII